jgi:hypothetical protein
MSDNGQRYVQRLNGFFVDAVSVDVYIGLQGATQIVALNASGYIDPSLIIGGGGGGVTVSGGVSTVNGVSGNIVISGGQGISVSVSGNVITISDTLTRVVSAVPGKPAAGQLVMIYPIESRQTYPPNFGAFGSLPPSVGSCSTNPTSTAVYSVYQNFSIVGTISVSIAGVFTFLTAGFTLLPGDRFTIVAPGSQDPTMADVGITLVGIRG